MNLELNPTTGVRLDLFGPIVELLTLPQEEHHGFCVLRGTIPPGVFIPLHAHPDTEDFFVLSGEMEGLRQDNEGHSWIKAKAGDYLHVSSNVRHALRNVSVVPVVALIITTTKHGRFFQEAGRPLTSTLQSPSPQDLGRFAAMSVKYDYWTATPEENAAVGIPFRF